MEARIEVAQVVFEVFLLPCWSSGLLVVMVEHPWKFGSSCGQRNCSYYLVHCYSRTFSFEEWPELQGLGFWRLVSSG